MALFGKLFKKAAEPEAEKKETVIRPPEPVELKPAPFNLNDTLRDVANIVSMDAQESHISIVYRMKKGVPSKLIGDRYKLARLLTELISNAIDFTDKREDVVVQIGRNEKNEESMELYFEVIDFGVGINPQLVSEKLMPMLTGDESAEVYGIQGQGLQRARDIVHAMQGSIRMTSEPKKGTRVSFHIQLSAPDLKEKRHYRLPNKEGVGLKTLVVDNDIGSAKAIVPLLEYFQHKVTIGKPVDLSRLEGYDLVMISSEYWNEAVHRRILDMGDSRPKVVMIESMIKRMKIEDEALSFVDWLIYKPFTQQFVFEMLTALYSDALKVSPEVEDTLASKAPEVHADGISAVSERVEAFLNGTPIEQTPAVYNEGRCFCCKYAHQFFVATDGLERCNNDYAAFVEKLKEAIWKYGKADKVVAGKIDQDTLAEAALYCDGMKTALADLGVYKLACLGDLLEAACLEGRIKDIETLKNSFSYVLNQTIASLDQFIDQAKYKIR